MPFIYILLLLLISIATPSWANDVVDDESFNRLVEKLRNHPEVQAYVEKAESQQYYGDGEKGLPDPMLMVGVQDYPIGSSASRDQQQEMIGFRQEIPNSRIRNARVSKAHAESEKTKLLADYAFAAMKAKFINALVTLQSIKEQQEIYKQQHDLFNTERKSLTSRIEANQASMSMLAMHHADQTELEISLKELEEQKHEIEVMLNNMLGEIPDIAPPTIEMQPWNGDSQNTYPVKISSRDITTAEKEIDIRKAEYGPNFEVQSNYGRMNSGDNAGTILVGVSIPLWNSSNQKLKLRGAKAGLRAAEYDVDTVKRQTVEKLTHLQAQIEISTKKIELFTNKLNSMNQAASAMVREYEAGKTDMPSILKTKRDALTVRVSMAGEKAKRLSLIADFNHYFAQEIPQ